MATSYPDIRPSQTPCVSEDELEQARRLAKLALVDPAAITASDIYALAQVVLKADGRAGALDRVRAL